MKELHRNRPYSANTSCFSIVGIALNCKVKRSLYVFTLSLASLFVTDSFSQNAAIIKLKNGNQAEVVILEENNEYLKIRVENGQVQKVLMSSVENIQFLGPASDYTDFLVWNQKTLHNWILQARR